MNLYAKLTDPQNGWNRDQDKAKEFLKTHDKEELLLVKEVAVDSSSTEVALSDYGDGWNSVQFTFFVEDAGGLVEYDIFKNELRLPQIRNVYVYF